MQHLKRLGLTKKQMIGLAFVLPVFLWQMCIVMIPAVRTLFMSFYEWNGLSDPTFIGLDNFKKMLFDDRVVHQALLNNVIWMVVFLIVPLGVGLLVAFFVNKLRHGQMVYRTIIFLPYVLSAAIAGKLWSNFLNPFFGFPETFRQMGLEALANISWLGDPKIALWTVMFINNWGWWGFVMVLFVAAFHQVDPELYEAVRVEGATGAQEFWYVTLPGIRHSLVFIITMSLTWSFMAFDYVWVITQGGPSHATEMLSTLIYQNAFIQFDSGYASTICVLQSVIIVLIFAFMQYFRKKAEE